MYEVYRKCLACGWRLLLAVLPSVLLVSAWPAAAQSLDPQPALTAFWVAEDGALKPFDPSQLSRVPRAVDGSAGAVARIYPQSGVWPTSPHMLVVFKPALEIVRWVAPDGRSSRPARLMAPFEDAAHGNGRIGFWITEWPAAGAPIELHFLAQSGISGTVHLGLQSQARFHREDAAWVGFASACFAVMVAMSLMAIFFGWKLRETVFFLYAGYILGYVLIQLVQTGFAIHPLGWTLMSDNPRGWGRVATIVATALAMLFLVRFASLERYAPVGRNLLLALAALALAVGLFGFVPVDALSAVSRVAINPLLMLAAPTMLAISLLAWWRGSRYAGFFLIGWTPLLVLTALDSAQLYGFAPGWTSLGDVAIAAATFEALVLSLGLADKTLRLRIERDRAKKLADSDPLTNLLNRRGLIAGLGRAMSSVREQGKPLALLFLDIDGFKQFNDRLGHAAGDDALKAVGEALLAETRTRDLLGRLGGEEFVVCLPRCGPQRAARIAERLRSSVAALPIETGVPGQPLTVSIGVAMLRESDSVHSLIARADQAMYEAKRTGRDRVCFEADAAHS